MSYIQRSLEPALIKAAEQFPVVVLTGCRQSGKTTLLKHLFGESCRYVSLELPDIRMAAETDPRGFLDFYAPPVIFDEAQYAPGLLLYIKERVDSHRDAMGQYFLTGSQNLLLHEKVTESLAGRAAMLTLMPLSYREMAGIPDAPLPWEASKPEARKPLAHKALWESFLRGGYPELIAHPKKDAALWQSSYIQTYLERDVRSLRQIGDLGQFQIFIRALAAQSAQLLNLTSLSRDLGVAVNTVKQWLSLLEATHQVHILRPYYANIGKRLVKTPKAYFSDVGILCNLVGIKEAEHAMNGPMSGAIMETAVVNEVMRTLWHRGEEPQVFFWRTSIGAEVDLIVDTGKELVPVEVKQTATPKPAMAKGIETFRADMQARAGKGYLIHSGEEKLPLSKGVIAWPFGEL